MIGVVSRRIFELLEEAVYRGADFGGVCRFCVLTIRNVQRIERHGRLFRRAFVSKRDIFRVIRNMLQHAKFDHAAHTGFTCVSCHSKALTSTESSDILLPGIETCNMPCAGAGAREIALLRVPHVPRLVEAQGNYAAIHTAGAPHWRPLTVVQALGCALKAASDFGDPANNHQRPTDFIICSG